MNSKINGKEKLEKGGNEGKMENSLLTSQIFDNKFLELKNTINTGN